METIEFSAITKESVAALLKSRGPQRETSSATGNRRTPRWPFPGTVQIWVTHEDGEEELVFASALNMSLHGVGIRIEEPLDIGTEVAIAIHEPEISFQGKAIVRHNTECERSYYQGLEFVFADSESKKEPSGW